MSKMHDLSTDEWDYRIGDGTQNTDVTDITVGQNEFWCMTRNISHQQLYKNAVLLNTDPGSPDSGNNRLTIGTDDGHSGGTNVNAYVDEVMILSKTLTQNNVEELYGAGNAKTFEDQYLNE